jgi:hypothetical protein
MKVTHERYVRQCLKDPIAKILMFFLKCLKIQPSTKSPGAVSPQNTTAHPIEKAGALTGRPRDTATH